MKCELRDACAGVVEMDRETSRDEGAGGDIGGVDGYMDGVAGISCSQSA
jgi:hypothetical protein